ALGLFGFLGLIVVWPILATNPARTVPIAVALTGAGLAVGCLIAARLGLIETVVRVFQRIRAGPAVDPRPARAAMSAKETITRAQGAQTGSVAASTIWHLAGWLVNVAELWLACHFLGLRPSLAVVFAGEALGALCDGVFFFVPMRIGAAEGGRVFLFSLLGLTAAQGLTLGVVRRVRELSWTAIGLVICPWLEAPDTPALSGGHHRAVSAIDPATGTEIGSPVIHAGNSQAREAVDEREPALDRDPNQRASAVP